MFSNPRSSKKEFFGIMRNIFTNSKPAKINVTVHQELNRDKKSFRKKVRSKLSFMRVDSIKLRRDRPQTMKSSPEQQRRFGRTSATPNLNFEDIDQPFNLSSILKNPNTSKSGIQKCLRFVENTPAMECSSHNMSLSDISVAMVTNAIDDVPTESDEHYYRRMKEKILSQGISVTTSKPKRNLSIKVKKDAPVVAQASTISITADNYHSTPESESSTHDSRNENIFGNLIEKYCVRTHLSPLSSSVSTTTDSGSNFEDTVRVLKGNREAFPDILLKKWQRDDDKRYIDSPGNSFDASTPMEIQNSDSRCDRSQLLFSRGEKGTSASNERDRDNRKIPSAKKFKGNRYDPMAMSETCAVSLCREKSMDCDRMSWCSVSSC